MDGVVLINLGHGLAVNGLADDVPDAAEGLGTDGHLHGLTGIGCGKAALQAVGRSHSDRADHAAGQLGLNLENRAQMPHRGIGLDRQCVVDRGDLAVELNVDNRPITRTTRPSPAVSRFVASSTAACTVVSAISVPPMLRLPPRSH